MNFKSLKERMLYYRGLSDYKLLPNSTVLVMVDGRSFSSKIKKLFKLPYDEKFIDMMNKTAEYVCKEVQGCKFAYVQSDEISFVLSDFDNPRTDTFYSYRLCKLQSIIASLATAKFNQLMMQDITNCPCSAEDMKQMIADATLYQFDCKAWNVPTCNDAISWLLYRQIDCVRNSKEVAAQTYLPKKQLFNKTCEEQIKWLKDEKGIDWNDYDQGMKYGRFIYKEEKEFNDSSYGTYTRNIWQIHDALDLTDTYNRTFIYEIIFGITIK